MKIYDSVKNLIKDKKLIILSKKNIRTGKDGSLWGKKARNSNIILENEIKQYGFRQDTIIAERWICSDDRQYPSVFITKHGKEYPLYSLLEKYPRQIFGLDHLGKHGPYLGTIMKLLDTNFQPDKGSLSLQVHPKKGYPEAPCKPEMWLSLSGDCKLYVGWNNNYSKEDILKGLKEKKIFEMVNCVSFPKGKKMLIKGGIVHAIRYGSFLAEWSYAPSKDDSKKGSLQKATFTLADNTDVRKQRPGKVNVNGCLDVFDHADTYYKVKIKDLYSNEKILSEDKAGNTIKEIFKTKEIVVTEITVASIVKIKNPNTAVCFYVLTGDVTVSCEDQDYDLKQGAEFISPAYIKNITIKNALNKPAIIYKWNSVATKKSPWALHNTF